jgi:hypothetical protein
MSRLTEEQVEDIESILTENVENAIDYLCESLPDEWCKDYDEWYDSFEKTHGHSPLKPIRDALKQVIENLKK